MYFKVLRNDYEISDWKISDTVFRNKIFYINPDLSVNISNHDKKSRSSCICFTLQDEYHLFDISVMFSSKEEIKTAMNKPELLVDYFITIYKYIFKSVLNSDKKLANIYILPFNAEFVYDQDINEINKQVLKKTNHRFGRYFINFIPLGNTDFDIRVHQLGKSV